MGLALLSQCWAALFDSVPAHSPGVGGLEYIILMRCLEYEDDTGLWCLFKFSLFLSGCLRFTVLLGVLVTTCTIEVPADSIP